MIQNHSHPVRVLLGDREKARLPQEGSSHPLRHKRGQHLLQIFGDHWANPLVGGAAWEEGEVEATAKTPLTIP